MMKYYPYDSYIWKSLSKTFPLFHKGLSWNVGNGNKIKIWDDNWIEASYSLRKVIEGPLNKNDSNASVSQLIINNNWDLSKLSFEIPRTISEAIQNTYIQTSPRKSDNYYWNTSNDGDFSTKGVYDIYLSVTCNPSINKNINHNWV